jgi:hypothetical protein
MRKGGVNRWGQRFQLFKSKDRCFFCGEERRGLRIAESERGLGEREDRDF